MVQRLIPQKQSETFYFRKREAGYSAYRLLHVKGKA